MTFGKDLLMGFVQTHHCCLEFGLGKSVMAQIIEEEALEAIESLKMQSGQDIKIEQNFNIHIFNILWRIATNTRYNVSNREMKKIDRINSLGTFNIFSMMIHS